jgi:hypothetical protein
MACTTDCSSATQASRWHPVLLFQVPLSTFPSAVPQAVLLALQPRTNTQCKASLHSCFASGMHCIASTSGGHDGQQWLGGSYASMPQGATTHFSWPVPSTNMGGTGTPAATCTSRIGTAAVSMESLYGTVQPAGQNQPTSVTHAE